MKGTNRSWRFGCLTAVLIVVSPPFILIAMRDLGEARTVTPSLDGLVGSWQSENGSIIALAADGTFVAKKMPTWLGLPSGNGTWTIRKQRDDTPGGIDLWTAGGQAELETKGSAAHPTLFAFIGDPDHDDEYVFAKQTASS